MANNNTERLFIKKIEINDCGRYYGHHEILLTDPNEKNITIIFGDSGTGKSTIHDLIYWCLYGEFKVEDDEEDKEKDSQDYGLINTDKLEDMEIGEEVTASVSISLHDKKGENFFLTRKLTAKYEKEQNGRYYEELNNSFVRKGTIFTPDCIMMAKDEVGNKEPVTDRLSIKGKINSLFPQDLSAFFLFDGENLKKFRRKSTSTGYIKEGIEKISGLGVLDKLVKTAKDTAEKISILTDSKNRNSAGLSKTYESLKLEIETEEKQLGENIAEEKKLGKKYEGIVARIARNKEGGKLNESQRKEIKSRTQARKDLMENKKDVQELLFEQIPNLLARKTFENCEKMFTKLEDEDKIPPSISRKAIDKILNSDPLSCVCGREFTKDDEAWEKLTTTREIIIDDQISNGLAFGADLIGRVLDSSHKDKVKEEFDNFISKSTQLRKNIEDYDTKIDALEEEIKKVEYDEGEDLGAQKSKVWNERTELEDKIRSDSFSLETKKTKKEKMYLDLKKARSKESKFVQETNKISILEAVAKFGKNQREEIADLFREGAQSATNTYFMETAPEKQSFDHVEISSKYEILARDSNGLEPPLSKGQGHVLGLSFVAGCRDVTHINTFLIIDSPLHNISGKPRNEISNALAKYLPGVQLVLLVTDTEYVQGGKEAKPVREILTPTNQIWKEYKIKQVLLDKTNKTGKRIESREIVEL